MTYSVLPVSGPAYRLLTVLLCVTAAFGLYCAYQMEHDGHIITGMSNQVVWGVPHVFAIFLILAASGALNVASVGSVFGQTAYKPLARLSALLSVALLVGGLTILVLDLGRPDRLIVAMTHFNFRSIFAWNIFLYSGFVLVVAVYIWTLMERRMAQHNHAIGVAAFIWRFVLTTGTGSIFGFLVAREAYDAAIMAPLFVAESLACGMAVFVLVAFALSRHGLKLLDEALLRRCKNLLGIFVATALYLIVAFHLTNLYAAEHQGFERYALLEDPIYSGVFWAGKILIGSTLPLLICLTPTVRISRVWVGIAALSTVAGTFSWLYVSIIGGQAYPLNIFPGYEVLESGFLDHVTASYTPTAVEFGLGAGGVALALLVVVLGLRVLPFLPVLPAVPDSA